mmetsp:Transcript_87258/g.169053  ORF Transcript_87258/g.169053 Transcript_87258/m.169053 type:complete len:91 (+) Transcript_87258:1504-1776(+)
MHPNGHVQGPLPPCGNVENFRQTSPCSGLSSWYWMQKELGQATAPTLSPPKNVDATQTNERQSSLKQRTPVTTSKHISFWTQLASLVALS